MLSRSARSLSHTACHPTAHTTHPRSRGKRAFSHEFQWVDEPAEITKWHSCDPRHSSRAGSSSLDRWLPGSVLRAAIVHLLFATCSQRRGCCTSLRAQPSRGGPHPGVAAGSCARRRARPRRREKRPPRLQGRQPPRWRRQRRQQWAAASPTLHLLRRSLRQTTSSSRR